LEQSNICADLIIRTLLLQIVDKEFVLRLHVSSKDFGPSANASIFRGHRWATKEQRPSLSLCWAHTISSSMARPRHGESITLSLLAAAAEEETRKAAAGAHPECGFYEIKVEVQEKRGNSSL